MIVDLKIVDHDVREALNEDIGSGDITACLLDKDVSVKAKLITREQFTLAGRDWFERSFMQVDDNVSIEWFYKDEQQVESGETVALVYGSARSILTAERTAINFMQTLSAVATKTSKLVSKLSENIALLDTRKTLPKLRYALKYAVTCGGGKNHRMGLYDAFLIKENHIRACGSIQAAVKKARALNGEIMVEVEVETLDELNQALSANADTIMLDNFSISMIKEAVVMASKKASKLEVSGGVRADNLCDYDIDGIDYISMGCLTKSVEAVDLSLQVTESHHG